MKLERSKNAARNVFWGMFNRIIIIFAQFILRIIVLKTLGSEYLGLNSLFSSVLSVLSLAELGIGSALVFHMYRAIVEENTPVIRALLAFYKKCYHTIAFVILILGLAIMPFIPYLVKDGAPDGLNLYILYAMNLSSTVISYSFFSYKGCLLEAHQRSDVVSKIAVFTNFVQYGLQIALLLVFKNYYLYCLVTPFIFLLTNFLTSFSVDRLYPEYRAEGKIEQSVRKSIFGQVKALVVYKAGGVVSTSLDSVVVSAFLGTAALGVYSNYYYVVSMLFAFFLMYYNSVTAGIGNSIVTESVEKNFTLFKKLLFIQGWLCGFCSVCLTCLYQDFITIWMGKDMLLPFSATICFVAYFYVWKAQDVVTVFKDAAGMWEGDRWRPLVSAGVNLVLNLVSVQFIGVYGVLLSTVVCCLAIDLPWSSHILFKNYFKKGSATYFIRLIVYTFVNAAVCAITYGVCRFVPESNGAGDILWFVLKMAICVILPNLLFALVYFRTPEFKSVYLTVKRTLRSFLGKLKKEETSGEEENDGNK